MSSPVPYPGAESNAGPEGQPTHDWWDKLKRAEGTTPVLYETGSFTYDPANNEYTQRSLVTQAVPELIVCMGMSNPVSMPGAPGDHVQTWWINFHIPPDNPPNQYPLDGSDSGRSWHIMQHRTKTQLDGGGGTLDRLSWFARAVDETSGSSAISGNTFIWGVDVGEFRTRPFFRWSPSWDMNSYTVYYIAFFRKTIGQIRPYPGWQVESSDSHIVSEWRNRLNESLRDILINLSFTSGASHSWLDLILSNLTIIPGTHTEFDKGFQLTESVPTLLRLTGGLETQQLRKRTDIELGLFYAQNLGAQAIYRWADSIRPIFDDSSSGFEFGTYTGNGSSSRELSLIETNKKPKAVLVIADRHSPVYVCLAHTTGTTAAESTIMDAHVAVNELRVYYIITSPFAITKLEPGKITMGSHTSVNENTVTYKYLVFY